MFPAACRRDTPMRRTTSDGTRVLLGGERHDVVAAGAVGGDVGDLVGLHLARARRSPGPRSCARRRRRPPRRPTCATCRATARRRARRAPSRRRRCAPRRPRCRGARRTPCRRSARCPAGTVASMSGHLDPRHRLHRRLLRPAPRHPVRVDGLPRRELHVDDPLRRRHVAVLPRHHHPHRVAVLGGQRLAVHRDGEHGVAAVGQRRHRRAARPPVDRRAEQLGRLRVDTDLGDRCRRGARPATARCRRTARRSGSTRTRASRRPRSARGPGGRRTSARARRSTIPWMRSRQLVPGHLGHDERRVDAVEVVVRASRTTTGPSTSRSAFGGSDGGRSPVGHGGQRQGGALVADVVATLEQAAGASGDRRQRRDADAAHQERAPVAPRRHRAIDRLDRRELVGRADGRHGVAGTAAPAASVGAAAGESHHSTAIDTSVPTTIGATLATVGSGRVSTAPTPMQPDRRAVMARATLRRPLTATMPDGDADDEQDRQRRDDEDRLVGRPERVDRPVLERERDEVDDLLADGDDGDTEPSTAPTSELAGGEPGARWRRGRGPFRRARRDHADRVPYDRSPMSTGLPDSLAALVAAAVESVDNATDEKLAQGDARVGARPDRRPTRHARPEDRRRRARRDARGVLGVRPLPRRPEGHGVRLGPHGARTTRSTSRRPRSPSCSPPAAGWSSPAPGRGSCRRRWRAPGASAVDRRVDPPAVRAGRQPGDRRRREVRQHEVLLHAQADARQGERGRSSACPAGSARSTRRSSCSRSTQTGKGLPVPIVLPRHRRATRSGSRSTS